MLFGHRVLRQWLHWKQWCGSGNTGIRQMGCLPKVNKDCLTIMTLCSHKLYRTFENGDFCNLNLPLFVIAQVSSISASGRRHWISAVLLWQPYRLVTKCCPQRWRINQIEFEFLSFFGNPFRYSLTIAICVEETVCEINQIQFEHLFFWVILKFSNNWKC